ncbi:Lactose transport system permease protein LacF [Blautia producta]|uniref:Lactose transport system permease protein LacF n=1 Tax=Blautia producta TaxID=33035 RepID=A0A4P6M206_9FIRM|nr:sugar ABC transporter permease [Blautia producta]QBE99171.1 Lactose transport system permease protein LacF [Blautia producta]
MKKSKIYPWYFAIGALIIYSALYVLPGLVGIGYSFTDWSSYSTEVHFVGLENFRQILGSNESYMKYIGNTLLFTVVTTVMKTGLALIFALALSKDIKLKNFHRGVMYMPSVLSILIIGLVFTSILNPKTGLLNEFLRTIGMEGLTQKWLTDPKIAFFSVMGVDIWRGTGYIMTILIVGILSISTTYYEAAGIDGAGGWKKFTKITLPLLRPTLAVTVVLNVLYGLKVFDMVYALTNGGPGHTTEVMYTAVFKQFSQGMYAVGTTISSIMFVFMVIIGFFMIRVLTGNEVKE